MEACRFYGQEPYKVVLLHGGPGACGSMNPVARVLSAEAGIMEPMQSALSVHGQLEELHRLVSDYARPPFLLAGHSWGAWLAFLCAARYPQQVERLVLIAGGPFDEAFAVQVQEQRRQRLSETDREAMDQVLDRLQSAGDEDGNGILIRMGALMERIDSFQPLPNGLEERAQESIRWNVYRNVWPEARAWRRSGQLLAAGRSIKCPVLAIHGDYDSHPADGVELPLREVLDDFRFVLLPRCGHKPWAEKQARESFYMLMKSEIHALRPEPRP